LRSVRKSPLKFFTIHHDHNEPEIGSLRCLQRIVGQLSRLWYDGRGHQNLMQFCDRRRTVEEAGRVANHPLRRAAAVAVVEDPSRAVTSRI
jgi:hypothetical protein